MTPKERAAIQHALEAIGNTVNQALATIREALAEPQITTPDVCGEVCARAKLCYGCNKDLEEANAKYAEQAEQEPEYDLSNVIHLTHNKAKHIIKSRGYSVTGFVLTREDGGKCIVDMSAVRWFDDKLVFQRMMHSDTPKEWLSPPVEHVKQEPVGVVTKESLDGVVKWNGWIPREGTKLYAAPVEPVKQEPVAWMDLHKELGKLRWMGGDEGWDNAINAVRDRLIELATPHPVRTKDLTDDEINQIRDNVWCVENSLRDFARAVIAADREKNK